MQHLRSKSLFSRKIIACTRKKVKRRAAGGGSPLTLRPNFNCKKGSVTAGGGSPPTLRPDFKCEKGSVTADKPPVRPAGGFLLTKIHKTKKPPLKKRGLCHKLANAVKIKVTPCTRKRLNINTTNTGKGTNRRWQAPGGQRGTSEFRRTVSTWLPPKVHFTEELPARSPHAPHFHPLTAAKRQKSTAPSCTSCCSVLYY